MGESAAFLVEGYGESTAHPDGGEERVSSLSQEKGVDHCEQLIRSKRFGQEIVCSRRPCGLLRAGVGREHDDRDLPGLLLVLEGFHNLAPIPAGEEHIQQDEFRQISIVQLLQVISFGADRNRVALQFEQVVQEVEDVRIVIDHKDFFLPDLHYSASRRFILVASGS